MSGLQEENFEKFMYQGSEFMLVNIECKEVSDLKKKKKLFFQVVITVFSPNWDYGKLSLAIFFIVEISNLETWNS